MERLARAVADRNHLASCLRRAFSSIPGWRLESVCPTTLDPARLLSGRCPDAVLVDLDEALEELVFLCELRDSSSTQAHLIGISCCEAHLEDAIMELALLRKASIIACGRKPLDRRLGEVLNEGSASPENSSRRPFSQLDDTLHGLSEEELLLVRFTAGGLRPEQIGERIGLSRHTVRHHLDTLRLRLGISTNAGLVGWASGRGLLDGEVLPASTMPHPIRLSPLGERKARPLRY